MPPSVFKRSFGMFGRKDLVRLLILTLIAFQGKVGHWYCDVFNSQGFDHEDSQPMTGSIIRFRPSSTENPTRGLA